MHDLRVSARRQPHAGLLASSLPIVLLFSQMQAHSAVNSSAVSSEAPTVEGLLQHVGSREGCGLLESTTPCSSIAPGSCLEQLAYSGTAASTKLVPVGGSESKSPDALCCIGVHRGLQLPGSVQVFEDEANQLQFFVRPYVFSRVVEVTIHLTDSLPEAALCTHTYAVVEGEAFGMHPTPAPGVTLTEAMPWDTLDPLVFLAIIFGIVLGAGLLCWAIWCLSRWRKARQDVAKVDAYMHAMRALEDQAQNHSPSHGLRHLDSLSPVNRNRTYSEVAF